VDLLELFGRRLEIVLVVEEVQAFVIEPVGRIVRDRRVLFAEQAARRQYGERERAPRRAGERTPFPPPAGWGDRTQSHGRALFPCRPPLNTGRRVGRPRD